MIDLFPSYRLEDFEYAMHELEDTISPEKLKRITRISQLNLIEKDIPDIAEIPPVINHIQTNQNKQNYRKKYRHTKTNSCK